MRFVPYDQATIPNIVVDGSANDHTVLTLSHWPQSGTPQELKADTSAEIAFNYLDSPRFHVECDAVTNNHFDQDGLVGVYALLDPINATRHRDFLIDVASAGDFGVFKSRDAARIAFVISTFADPATSPLPAEILHLPYPRFAVELYERVLAFLPRLIEKPEEFKAYWQDEDFAFAESEELVKKGTIAIEEISDLDLAVVHLPEVLFEGRIHRFASAQRSLCHPLAIYNATDCTRILQIQGQHVEFQYRYETWVQFVSRRPPARIDLAALADELNLEETGGKWSFDGVDAITPRLHLEGKKESAIPVDVIRRRLEQHLVTGAPAWDPHAPAHER